MHRVHTEALGAVLVSLCLGSLLLTILGCELPPKPEAEPLGTLGEDSAEDGTEEGAADESTSSTESTESTATDPPETEDDPGSDGICDPSTTAFGFAMCLCEDLDEKGNGFTIEPLLDPLAPSAHDAHVGVNGEVSTMGNLIVDGDLDIRGALLDYGNTEVGRDLLVGKDATIAGRMTVAGDARFGGDLWGAGFLDIEGGLNVAGQKVYFGYLEYKQKKTPAYADHDPCPCGDAELIDIAGIVAAHRTDTALELPKGYGHQVFSVGSGDYYTADESVFAGNCVIEIDGKVRLFVENDIQLIGNGKIRLTPGSQLDLYISGSLEQIGNFHFGEAYDPLHPEPARVYVGGSSPIVIIGNESFVGGLYAPRSDIWVAGNLKVVGSVFASTFEAKGNIMLSHNKGLVDDDCDDDGSDLDTDAGLDTDSGFDTDKDSDTDSETDIRPT